MAEIAIIPETDHIADRDVDAQLGGEPNLWKPVMPLIAALHEPSQKGLASDDPSDWQAAKTMLWTAALTNPNDPNEPNDVTRPMTMDDVQNTCAQLGINIEPQPVPTTMVPRGPNDFAALMTIGETATTAVTDPVEPFRRALTEIRGAARSVILPLLNPITLKNQNLTNDILLLQPMENGNWRVTAAFKKDNSNGTRLTVDVNLNDLSTVLSQNGLRDLATAPSINAPTLSQTTKTQRLLSINNAAGIDTTEMREIFDLQTRLDESQIEYDSKTLIPEIGGDGQKNHSVYWKELNESTNKTLITRLQEPININGIQFGRDFLILEPNADNSCLITAVNSPTNTMSNIDEVSIALFDSHPDNLDLAIVESASIREKRTRGAPEQENQRVEKRSRLTLNQLASSSKTTNPQRLLSINDAEAIDTTKMKDIFDLQNKLNPSENPKTIIAGTDADGEPTDEEEHLAYWRTLKDSAGYGTVLITHQGKPIKSLTINGIEFDNDFLILEPDGTGTKMRVTNVNNHISTEASLDDVARALCESNPEKLSFARVQSASIVQNTTVTQSTRPAGASRNVEKNEARLRQEFSDTVRSMSPEPSTYANDYEAAQAMLKGLRDGTVHEVGKFYETESGEIKARIDAATRATVEPLAVEVDETGQKVAIVDPLDAKSQEEPQKILWQQATMLTPRDPGNPMWLHEDIRREEKGEEHLPHKDLQLKHFKFRPEEENAIKKESIFVRLSDAVLSTLGRIESRRLSTLMKAIKTNEEKVNKGVDDLEELEKLVETIREDTKSLIRRVERATGLEDLTKSVNEDLDDLVKSIEDDERHRIKGELPPSMKNTKTVREPENKLRLDQVVNGNQYSSTYVDGTPPPPKPKKKTKGPFGKKRKAAPEQPEQLDENPRHKNLGSIAGPDLDTISDVRAHIFYHERHGHTDNKVHNHNITYILPRTDPQYKKGEKEILMTGSFGASNSASGAINSAVKEIKRDGKKTVESDKKRETAQYRTGTFVYGICEDGANLDDVPDISIAGRTLVGDLGLKPHQKIEVPARLAYLDSINNPEVPLKGPFDKWEDLLDACNNDELENRPRTDVPEREEHRAYLKKLLEKCGEEGIDVRDFDAIQQQHYDLVDAIYDDESLGTKEQQGDKANLAIEAFAVLVRVQFHETHIATTEDDIFVKLSETQEQELHKLKKSLRDVCTQANASYLPRDLEKYYRTIVAQHKTETPIKDIKAKSLEERERILKKLRSAHRNTDFYLSSANRDKNQANTVMAQVTDLIQLGKLENEIAKRQFQDQESTLQKVPLKQQRRDGNSTPSETSSERESIGGGRKGR